MSLKEKLQKLNESAPITNSDWQKKKDDWQKQIEAVLKATKEWFKPYIESNLFQLKETKKDITEEFIGTYTVNQLEFEFGSFRLVFEPVGLNIIGAMGRIDVFFRGNKTDKYILILLETKEGEAKWFIAPFKDKTLRVEYTNANIESIIETWIDQNTI